jgi:hypothetical protein
VAEGVLLAMELAPTLGMLAGVTGVLNTVPYVRDTVRRSTIPHRGAWLIWFVLAALVCFSQRADGASWSLVMCAVQVVMNGLVLALAIRLGVGGMSRGEAVPLVLAALGMAGWALADDPLVATAAVVVADLSAFALMVPKSWRDPGSETLSTFAIASVGGALATLAVAAPDASLLLYPAYFCAANGGMALMLWWRRAAPSTGPLRRARRRSPSRGAAARARRAAVR